jgi:tetratricopeptide (TPR) repeat protein
MFPNIKCDHCEKVLGEENLKRCSRCRLVYYCSADCQKLHWKKHKEMCYPMHQILPASIHQSYAFLIENDEEEEESESTIINQQEELHEIFCFHCHSSFEASTLWNPAMKHLAKSSQIIRLMKQIRSQHLDTNADESAYEYEEMMKHCRDKVLEELDIFEHKFHSKHPGTFKMMSELYFVMRDYTKALAFIVNIDESVLGQTSNSQLHLQYAKCYIELKDYASALKSYGKAIALMVVDDPCRIEVLLGCSRCFYELGSYEQAIQSSEGAIVLNRHYLGAYTYLAKSYEKQGRLDLAVAWLKQAIRYETPWDEKNIAAIREAVKVYENQLTHVSSKVADAVSSTTTSINELQI